MSLIQKNPGQSSLDSFWRDCLSLLAFIVQDYFFNKGRASWVTSST